MANVDVQTATGFQASHWLVLVASLNPRSSDNNSPTDTQRILLESLRSAWRDVDTRDALRIEIANLLNQYEQIIAEAIANGSIDPHFDVKLLARVFLAIPIGFSSLTLAGAPDLTPQAFIDLFVRFNEMLLPKPKS